MKVRLVLLTLAVAVLTFAACSDDDVVAPTPPPSQFNTTYMPITVPNTGGQYGNMSTDSDGNLLFPDPGGNGNLYTVNRSTGQLRIVAADIGVAQGGPFQMRGVVYVPNSDEILVAASPGGQIWSVNPNDGSHTLLTDLGSIGSVCALSVAPAGFGSYGGQVIITGMSGCGVRALDLSNPTTTTVITAWDLNNAEFASDGRLYCTDYNNDQIVWVAADGTVTIYATGVPTPDGIAVAGGTIYVTSDTDTLYAVTSSGAVVTNTQKHVDISNTWAPTGLVYDNGKLLAGVQPTSDYVVDDVTP